MHSTTINWRLLMPRTASKPVRFLRVATSSCDPTLAVQDAPCPFKNETFCATKEAFNVDSGLLDVGTTFGLNIAAKDCVQYRKSTTCTAFPMKGHWDVYNVDDVPDLLYTLPNEEIGLVSYDTTSGEVEWATYQVSMTMANVSGRITVGS
jgi:hypothetical protein